MVDNIKFPDMVYKYVRYGLFELLSSFFFRYSVILRRGILVLTLSGAAYGFRRRGGGGFCPLPKYDIKKRK